MNKLFLIITIILFSSYTYAQDTIRITSGEKILAKVIEINKSEIKYKKFNNLEGPNYSIDLDAVINITYQNGTKDIFQKVSKPITSASNTNVTEDFTRLTKAKNKVFIESKDKSAVIHATKAIDKWGYWTITKDKEQADFVLNFIYRFAGLGDVFGYAEFINPETGNVFKKTKEVNSMMSMDFNSKRGVMNKIVKKQIKPLFRR